MITFKPFRWRAGKSRQNDDILNGPHDLIQVYPCKDGTWRVWFAFGKSTSEVDDKLRNLPTREAAMEAAMKWWEEWVMMFIEEEK